MWADFAQARTEPNTYDKHKHLSSSLRRGFCTSVLFINVSKCACEQCSIFIVQVNNFALTTGFYWSYSCHPFLCVLGRQLSCRRLENFFLLNVTINLPLCWVLVWHKFLGFSSVVNLLWLQSSSCEWWFSHKYCFVRQVHFLHAEWGMCRLDLTISLVYIHVHSFGLVPTHRVM